MLHATFDFAHDKMGDILEVLLSLPRELRPTHHSDDERRRGSLIGDQRQFIERTSRQGYGLLLSRPKVKYNLTAPETMPIVCDCFLDAEPKLARRLVEEMAKAGPVFGYACVPEEERARNQLKDVIGVNTILSWVGRNPQKHIPGFYWLTLLPEVLMSEHGVLIGPIEKAALEHVKLPGAQHLFRFYDRPEEWKTTDTVAELCSTLPGVFDIEKVKPLVASVGTWQEYSEIVRNWK